MENDCKILDDILGRMLHAHHVDLAFPCAALDVRGSVLPLLRQWQKRATGATALNLLALGQLDYATPQPPASSSWPVDGRTTLDELVQVLWREPFAGTDECTVKLNHAVLGTVQV